MFKVQFRAELFNFTNQAPPRGRSSFGVVAGLASSATSRQIRCNQKTCVLAICLSHGAGQAVGVCQCWPSLRFRLRVLGERISSKPFEVVQRSPDGPRPNPKLQGRAKPSHIEWQPRTMPAGLWAWRAFVSIRSAESKPLGSIGRGAEKAGGGGSIPSLATILNA